MSSKVLDRYPPSRIPFELLDDLVNESKSADGMVKLIQTAHKQKGRDVSKEKVLNHLDKVSASMGLSQSEGRGLFGDIARGVGHVLKNAGGRVASHVWEKFKEDPVGTIANAVNLGTELASTVPVI